MFVPNNIDKVATYLMHTCLQVQLRFCFIAIASYLVNIPDSANLVIFVQAYK